MSAYPAPDGAARQRTADGRFYSVIFALDDFHEQHGLLSDDFPSLLGARTVPQFAVYKNLGRNPSVPFVLQFQSARPDLGCRMPCFFAAVQADRARDAVAKLHALRESIAARGQRFTRDELDAYREEGRR
jgi:hypothetical protein